MLARIDAAEFQQRLLESDQAKNAHSYEGRKIIFEHLDEDENYVMQSASDIAGTWAESTFSDLQGDFDWDDSFNQISKDAQDGCDGSLEQYSRMVIAGVCEWLSDKTIFLNTAGRLDGDLDTTSFIYDKNF
tara:strand:+ start:1905 stop:2297 length:393 start_codon:yes stop_codon:yes gene_type:complete